MLDLEIHGPVRCYNGCYDSRTQATIDRQNAALARIQAACPDARCTYYPAEGYYMVHVNGWPISDEEPTRGAAITSALKALRLAPYDKED